MKKIFIQLCTIAALGLALTACNNDAENKKAMDADNSAVDQMVQDKLKTLDDSISKACDANTAAAVEAKIDSMAAAGHKAAQAHRTAHPHVEAPAPTPEPKKEEPKPKGPPTKADKMGGTDANPAGGADKASKMGGTDQTTKGTNNKASKMGGNQ